ncbi:4Fe-4S binding protein [Planctomycetota bacterium]|nr:4Fe-4S binding protein [Planctomycetota bacterium]
MAGKLHGGMIFNTGKPYPWPALPQSLPAQPLRMTCPNTPIVSVGQAVVAGQRLTEPLHPMSPCFFSPVAGTVSAITPWEPDALYEKNHHRDPHTRKHPAKKLYDVHIHPIVEDDGEEGEGEGKGVPTSLKIAAPTKPDVKEWFDHLRNFGPWQQDEIGCDLITQLAASLQAKGKLIRHLVCIGLDAYSPYPDRSSLLMTFPDDAVLGLQILGNLLDIKRPRLLVQDNPDLIDVLKRPCKSFDVKLVADFNRYPAADPTLVAYRHCGETMLTANAAPTDGRMVMVTPWTVIRIARWVTRRRLDLVQPVMIAEPQRDKHPQRHYAFPGTEICAVDHTLHGCPQRLEGKLISGNPMTGLTLHAPLTENKGLLSPTIRHSTQMLTILASSHFLDSTPCNTCGWCTDVCPTGLQPVHLAESIQNFNSTKEKFSNVSSTKPTQTVEYPKQIQKQLDYCIDCGLCTHVCPTHLPIAQTIRAAIAKQKG